MAQPVGQKNKKVKLVLGINTENLVINNQPEPDINQAGMVNIFNGNNLSGWCIKGGLMKFTVSNGELIGTCDPDVRLNSFLVTKKSYSDLILNTN